MYYEEMVRQEMRRWQKKMQSKPAFLGRISRAAQEKINSYIPEKIHRGITAAISQMIRTALFGYKYLTRLTAPAGSLQDKEAAVDKRIDFYRKMAAAEGGLTGAGGFFLGLADFPILLGIKLKMLFDIAALYGFNVKDYRERVFILHIFQLAFSSQQHRAEVYREIIDWESVKQTLPDDMDAFDWRSLQQEYRDYIDLAKMAQLIPGIGAVVGLVVNYKLIGELGSAAKNAYRMRIFDEQDRERRSAGKAGVQASR